MTTIRLRVNAFSHRGLLVQHERPLDLPMRGGPQETNAANSVRLRAGASVASVKSHVQVGVSVSRFSQIVVLGVVAAATFSCGSSEDSGASPTPATSAASERTGAPVAEDDGTAPPAAEYKMLTKKQVEDALLSISDMPAGYAEEPVERDDGKNDTYCGYEPPSQPDVKVRHDYVKGGGLSSELISVSIGQYESEAGPEGYLRDFTKQLETCKFETIDGEKVKYAVMSVPQLGDAAIGVRVEGESYSLAADMAKVGPVLIVVGGGGVMTTDVDEINDLFEKQVDKYLAAGRT